MQELQRQAKELQLLLEQCIQQMLDNGPSLEDLLEKTENLRYQSTFFKRRARELHQESLPFYKRDRFIASICAGIALAVSVSMLVLGLTGAISMHNALAIALGVVTLSIVAFFEFRAPRKVH